MDPLTLGADVAAFYITAAGALLFGAVFLFIWHQAKVVYFGLWSVAWLLRAIAAFCAFELTRSGSAAWLAPYATFEFAFVIVLIAAARAGFASSMKEWRTVLRLISILPIFVALAWAFGRGAGPETLHSSHAVALAFVYVFNFVSLRKNTGLGARIFRGTLLFLAAAFLANRFLAHGYFDGAHGWAAYVREEAALDFGLHAILAFAAMAMWNESQIDRIRELGAEVDRLRREKARSIDLDGLTGLLNQAALARRIEESQKFQGVVAVCDMDNFKDVNDSYGHLVGDEILRNIGSLLQSSIRHEDEAFRWGGDEFVILFQDQHADVARKRMADIEARLHEFRVRGFGALPISFSWGTAVGDSRSLREAVDEADRDMYALKRRRAARTAGDSQP
jgi:diguanylate cyclase (GGDEF)-like protein